MSLPHGASEIFRGGATNFGRKRTDCVILKSDRRDGILGS
jgi:hypothetical protein